MKCYKDLLPEPAESRISIARGQHTANSAVLEISLGLFVVNSHHTFLYTRETKSALHSGNLEYKSL